MSLFADWNLLLLEEYFSPSKACQDVWIPTTWLELEGIGVHKGGANGLIEAVKQGPSWFHGHGHIADKAHKLVMQRLAPSNRTNGYREPGDDLEVYQDANAPTYLPYIALWVLAHSEAESSGFYAKVSELVCAEFPSNTREQMEYVWSDLQYWSSFEAKEKFGKFKLNVLGSHRYVGMAYAQAMVTHKDIDGISRLFGSCRLHPGQSLNAAHFEQLLEHGQHSNYLSRGLKVAMGKSDYRDHLEQLLSAYLEFWDGRVPKRKNAASDSAGRQLEHHQVESDELSVVLMMKAYGDVDCWEIGWRLPATATGLSYAIKVGDGEEAKARLELAGTHVHCVSSVNQNDARRVLNQSALESVESTFFFTGSDDELGQKKIHLGQDKVRILIWDRPDPALSDALLEREMPVTGPAYLLYSHNEYSNLGQYLTNEEIAHEAVDISGLPDQWGLICINDTEGLTTEQRAVIVDEEPAALAKARIRFVGGKPIIGAGNKKYTYYDLPIIELEAPAGAELSSIGLTFEELDNVDDACVKRFKFCLNDGSGSVFKIKAKLDNEELCTAGLQVLTTGGLGTATRHHFSLDKFGRALADASGLKGAIIGETQANDINIDYFHVDEKSLVVSAGIDIRECMKSNVPALFLDSMAASNNGSMSYGVARDQIRRLGSNVGIDDIEPALLIRELRRRGHVEIETNVKGHMVRICAVLPTIYSLPMRDREQRQLYGVCGSLMLQHWNELSSIVGCEVYIEKTTPDNLPAVRIAPFTQLSISALAKSANFQVVDLPIQNLFQWVGSIQERKENLSWYQEQGFRPNYLKTLNPSRGLFRDAENIMVNSELKYELFKYEDQQIQGLNVYKLGENLGEGHSKYSFIQDSRWGVWMAIEAFAKYVKTEYCITDASPWPFHYDSITGCLWLPARMEPPFVIERLLALCAGESPIIVQVTGEVDGESILLAEKDQQMIGRVSSVYSEMANGKWLCYRWVPRVIANKVANLLSGELQELR